MEPCGAKWTASTNASAPAAWARRTISRTGLTVPSAFDAYPNATSRVLGPRAASSESRSRVPSSAWMSTVCTTSPRSAAIARQGDTFASWSSVVTTISSPVVKVAAIDRLTWNVSVVMLAPNLTSSGEAAPRKAATPAWAAAVSESVAWLVMKDPPLFAFIVR